MKRKTFAPKSVVKKPHPWTPEDGVIYSFPLGRPKSGLNMSVEELLRGYDLMARMTPNIGEDAFGPPYPRNVRAVNGKAIGADGYEYVPPPQVFPQTSWWKKFWNKIRRKLHVGK